MSHYVQHKRADELVVGDRVVREYDVSSPRRVVTESYTLTVTALTVQDGLVWVRYADEHVVETLDPDDTVTVKVTPDGEEWV